MVSCTLQVARLEVVHYSVSCVLFRQFCIIQSVVLSLVYYSVSCVLLIGQLCITRSVVYYSVSCVLFRHLCITPSDKCNPLFPVDINFERLSNFTQMTQLIGVVKKKFFQTWEYYPQNRSNKQRGL